jgi:hypothetical protein
LPFAVNGAHGTLVAIMIEQYAVNESQVVSGARDPMRHARMRAVSSDALRLYHPTARRMS